MKNNFKNCLKFISLLFILVISIGIVSASDINLLDSNNNDLSLANEDINEVDNGIDLSSSGIDLSSSNTDLSSSSSDSNLISEKNLNSNTKTKENSLSSNTLQASVISVNHTGDDLKDIQTAIESASRGDTVDLGDYQYNIGNGQINLTKSITLTGNGINTTINASGGEKTGCVISVKTINSATIKGIIFNNPTADLSYTDWDTLYGWAIRLDSSDRNLIDNCSFINYNRAVNIDASDNNTVTNSFFTGIATRITNGEGKERGTRAISFSTDSANNFIMNNTFYGAMLDGINLDAAFNTTISGNNFINNSYAIYFDSTSINTTVTNNTFVDCGHFQSSLNGTPIDFNNLSIINFKKTFEDLLFSENTFYVSNDNVLILVDQSTEIGNINITNNVVKPLEEYGDLGYNRTVDVFNSSTIKFIKFSAKRNNLDLFDTINISDNDLPSGMIYASFSNDEVQYIEDGDLILYGPRIETVLNILTDSKIYANSVVINLTLNAKDGSDLIPLNETIYLTILDNKDYNKTYAVKIDDGKGQFINNETLEVKNYTIITKYLGDSVYDEVSNEVNIVISGIINTIKVVPSSNNTKAILDAIESANEGDIIDLGNYTFYDLETMTVDKEVYIIADGAILELSEDSSSLFNLNENANITIENVIFDVSEDNQSLILIDNSSFDSISLFNITTITSENLDNKTISLIRFNSDSNEVAFENINLKDNVLLNGMKSILVSTPNSTTKVIIIDNGTEKIINNTEYIIINNTEYIYVNVTPNRTATEIIYGNMSTVAVNTAVDGRIGEYFTIVLKDSNGKPLANKFVQIGFNANVYNRTTDENGSAKLQINLKNQGTYTFAVCFLGDDEYNGSFVVAKITVSKQSPKITSSSKTYKASAKTKTLTATFKSVKGNPISGKKISFTLNGKTYTAITNSNGLASVKVSLNKKGTYSCTVKYAGDTCYNSVSTKISVKIN